MAELKTYDTSLPPKEFYKQVAQEKDAQWREWSILFYQVDNKLITNEERDKRNLQIVKKYYSEKTLRRAGVWDEVKDV